MYKGLLESIAVIFLALLGITDAWRLSKLVRTGSPFHDVIGPDRYLGFICAGLLICGIWSLVAGLKSGKSSQRRPRVAEESHVHVNLVILVAFLLVVYTFAIQFLGYLPATSVFFPILYFIFGVRPWLKSILVGLVTTALFYAIFAYFAEMPLPKGLLENIL